MNRICIVFSEKGDIAEIVADEPLEILMVDPSTLRDRVYRYESAEFGPEHVRKWVAGFPVGHMYDGTLPGLSDEGGKLRPSEPYIRLVDKGSDHDDTGEKN